MTRSVTVAVVQCELGRSRQENTERVEKLVREAAGLGAQVVLPPELFEGPYFPRVEDEAFFAWARPVEDNPNLQRFSALARELEVVIPFSFFERSGPAYYNSLCLLDADGRNLGLYRKSHIPDGPGYEEKFYFRPGETGFKVWRTRFGTLGIGICWDQWFPECARSMALLGAELLLYPTAIGSEPASGEDTADPWQRAMIGHAVSNAMPVAAANRIGDEGGQRFYGRSFIASSRGDRVAEIPSGEEGIRVHSFDLAAEERRRAEWGFFRDRRPDLYRTLLTADGRTPAVDASTTEAVPPFASK
ncbi:MAG: N-carbamoylputrescine amidase [Myxococcota bacterium]